MALSFLESIRHRKRKEKESLKSNRVKNLQLLIEPYRKEIWEAFLEGCYISEIYKELNKRKIFPSPIYTFRMIFNKMFPNAKSIRKEYMIKKNKEIAGINN